MKRPEGPILVCRHVDEDGPSIHTRSEWLEGSTPDWEIEETVVRGADRRIVERRVELWYQGELRDDVELEPIEDASTDLVAAALAEALARDEITAEEFAALPEALSLAVERHQGTKGGMG